MNPWLIPDNTGDSDTDLANALRARYGDSDQAIFRGLGRETSVPVRMTVKDEPAPAQDYGVSHMMSDNSADIYLDPKMTPDQRQSTLAHEIGHVADFYSAPYPLKGPSHHYFYGQFEPEMNAQLRAHMANEEKNGRSERMPNPWAAMK
jgi:hypothetical protein